ncbi:MAG: serine hydrolase domain-containing protein [Acidimicrobiales bacterium]
MHPDFAGVAGVFRQQLARTTGGAAVAVYHRGELVVDLWGGRRVRPAPDGALDGPEEPWEGDTLAMCFSSTKGLTSTALHLLADRGLVDYEAPVAAYWPEFAANGKEGVTVAHLLTHSAGLHRLRTVIDRADRMLDWDHMVEALAAARPAYEPGTQNGYHALTYGWLVGEVVRRVSGQPLDEFVQREIVEPLGLGGLYLGCPPEQRYRVAPLEPMGRALFGPRPARIVQRRVGEQLGKLASAVRSPINPRRMINALAPRGIEDVLWAGDVMDASIPAANGFFDARSLARMYAMIAGHGEIDGVRLLSPATVERMARVRSRRRDLVLVMPMRWRYGYHLVGTTRGLVDEAFGHFGFGGSGGWCDPGRDVAVAMVCNRGSGTPIGDLRLLQLGTAVDDAVRERDADQRGAA